jgi:uncharacterized protein (TIRG00374 family)
MVVKDMKNPVVRFIITVAISGGALYFAFRNVNFPALYLEFKHANIFWIVGGVALMFLSHLVRAWRWTVILRPMKKNTSTLIGFKSILAGYGMNNVIPRSGELVRPFIFAKHESLFMSGTIASIMVERVADLLSMVIFLMCSLFLFPRELAKAFPSIADHTMEIFSGMLLLLALVLIMIFKEKRTVAIIFWMTRRWPAKIRVPVDRAATEFSIALADIRASGALPVFFGTVGIWFFYVLSMYASLYAFPEHELIAVGLIGAFFLRVLSGLAFLIPTPGGTGSYHFFISQALTKIFGVSLPVAIAYATLTHAANYILTAVTGIIIVLTEGFSLKNITAVIKKQERDVAKVAAVSPPPVVSHSATPIAG